MMKREVMAAPSSNKKAKPAVPTFVPSAVKGVPPAATGEPANKKAKAESPALMVCKVEISKASAVKSGRLPATPQNHDSATAKAVLPPPPKPPHPLPPTAPIATPLQIKAPPPPTPKAPTNAYTNLPQPKAITPATPPATKAAVVVKPTLSQKAAALRQRPPRPSTKVEPFEPPVEPPPVPSTKVPPLKKAPPPTPPPSATEAPTEAGLQDNDALMRLEDYVRTRVSKMDDEEVKRKIEKCKQHPAFGEYEKYRMAEFGVGDELPPFGEEDMDEELICFVCWAENPANPFTAAPDPNPSETATAAVVVEPSPKAAAPSPKNAVPTVAAASASHQEPLMRPPPTPKSASPSPPKASQPIQPSPPPATPNITSPSSPAPSPKPSPPPPTSKSASPSSPPAIAPATPPNPKANPSIGTKLHQFNVPKFVQNPHVTAPEQSTAPPPPPVSLAHQIHVASPASELQLEYLE